MRFPTPSSPAVIRVWLIVFGLWLFFLSGIPAGITHAPGILQAIRLQRLLTTKETQVKKMEDEIHFLDAERIALEKSRITQEREIRRVLGYAARDEIIFDFAAAVQLSE